MPGAWDAAGVTFGISFSNDQTLGGVTHTAYLDNIVLIQVPEPSVFALFGLGAFLFATGLRRSQRVSAHHSVEILQTATAEAGINVASGPARLTVNWMEMAEQHNSDYERMWLHADGGEIDDAESTRGQDGDPCAPMLPVSGDQEVLLQPGFHLLRLATKSFMKLYTSLRYWGILLSVCLVPPSAHCQGIINAGIVQVTSVGHTFTTNITTHGPLAMDYLIDQQQTSGGGAVLGVVSANFDVNTQFCGHGLLLRPRHQLPSQGKVEKCFVYVDGITMVISIRPCPEFA